MTSPPPEPINPEPISGPLDLSQNEFWGRPPAERYAAYAQLRAMPQPPYFEAPESPFVLLLPVLGVAVLGGGMLWRNRRARRVRGLA